MLGGGELERDGFAKLPGLVDRGEIECLRTEVECLQVDAGRVCVRDILRRSERIARLASELAAGRCAPLAGLLPVRGILFDKTPSENGALHVLPGTHRSGKLAATEIAEQIDHSGGVICACDTGDGLLMKPLILHSSARAGGQQGGRHRRVIHIEFAPSGALADELAWHELSVSKC